jgi:hypothetical protein
VGALLLAAIYFSVRSKYYLSVLHSKNRYRLTSILRILANIGAVLVLFFVDISVVTLAVSVVAAELSLFLFVRYTAIGESTASTQIDIGIKKEIFAAIYKTGFSILLGFATVQCLTLYVGKIATVENAISFMFMIKVISVLRQFSNVPFYSSLTTLNTLFANNSTDLLSRYRKYSSFTYLVYIAGMVGLALVIPFSRSFDLEVFPSGLTSLEWLLISSIFLSERISMVALNLFTLTGRVVWHRTNLIAAASILIGVVLFSDYYGYVACFIALYIGYVLVLPILSTYYASQMSSAVDRRTDIFAYSLAAGVSTVALVVLI